MKNSFQQPKHVDHAVVDENGNLVGEVRVKPSGLSWRGSGKSHYLTISLERFAEIARAEGKKTKF